MWTFIRWFVSFLLSVLLWYLQELPTQPEKWYDKLFTEYKYDVFCWALVLVITLQVASTLYEKYKRGNEVRTWMNSFLNHILIDKLGGRNYQTRITLLRPMKGYRLWYDYFIKYPFSLIRTGNSLPQFNIFKRNIPNAFKKYLYVYARRGHSDDQQSYTHFLINNRNEPVNSIAVRCFREETNITIQTKRVSHITIPQTYKEAIINEDLRQYMIDTYVTETNYSTFLSINTRSNNFFAVPILNEEQDKVWAVLIIDNDEDREISYNEQLDSYIGEYQKIISYTLKTLN